MNKFLQKSENIINSASEVFLLIAVITLISLPFAVAANLNPIVKESTPVADNNSNKTAGNSTPAQKNVLGEQTSVPKDAVVSFNAVTAQNNLMEMSNFKKSLTSASMTVNIKSEVRGDVFYVENNTAQPVSILPVLDTNSSYQVSVYMGAKSYSGFQLVPVNLQPGQNITIGLISTAKSYPLKVDISVKIQTLQ